jgi:predicted nucleic acid-binding protein
MGVRYLYDTNIFIYYLGDEPKVEKLFTQAFLEGNEAITSTVVRMEVLSFPDMNEEEETKARGLLEQFEAISINKEIEEMAISIRRKFRTKMPDAIIAATAFWINALLVTRNTDDFTGISGLQVYNPFIE